MAVFTATIGHNIGRNVVSEARPDVPRYTNAGDCVPLALAVVSGYHYDEVVHFLQALGVYRPDGAGGVNTAAALAVAEELLHSKARVLAGCSPSCGCTRGNVPNYTLRDLVRDEPEFTGMALIGADSHGEGHAVPVLDGQPANLGAEHWDIPLVAVVPREGVAT